MGKEELRQAKGMGGGVPERSERRGHEDPSGRGASPNRSGGASTRCRPTPHMDASG
jgi:hypothetical protein